MTATRFLKSLFVALLLFTQSSLAAVTVFQEDWEVGFPPVLPAGWTIDNGVWEMNPAADSWCHGGVQCVGTVWGGDYPPGTDSRLISPPIDLSGVAPLPENERLHLRYWQWFSLGFGDYGYVQVSVLEPGTQVWSAWQNASPTAVQDVSDTGTNSSDWSRNDVDLSVYAGQTVRIAFYHTASSSYESWGWFVDDISVERVTVATAPVSWGFEGASEDDWWGDWGADRAVWQINQAPDPSCHGGEHCFGTDYWDTYPAGTDSRLISPPVQLPPVTPGEAWHLRYWQWFSLGFGDYGHVQVSTLDPVTQVWSDWSPLTPPVTVQDESGDPWIWNAKESSLTAFAGQTVRIAFYHPASSSSESWGWFVDDVAILTADDSCDGDGVGASIDNCPCDYNPDQEDTDGNGIGNACQVRITGLWPATAPVGEWVSLFVFGKGFETNGSTDVDLNGNPVSLIYEASSGMLIARVQVAASDYGPLTVTTPGGTDTIDPGLQPPPPPTDLTVTGIWPSSLTAGDWASIFIFGSGFTTDGTTQVTFNGDSYTWVAAPSTQMLIVRLLVTPDLSGPVCVTTPAGTACIPWDPEIVVP
jgi:hypothetical protein